jgi:hypothetical protein
MKTVKYIYIQDTNEGKEGAPTCLYIKTIDPMYFVCYYRSFAALNVLKKLAGVWIVGGKKIIFNQACAITFLCPMRFDLYPMDSHVCKFRVGSTNLDMRYMRFTPTVVTYDESARNTILDYSIDMGTLKVIMIHVQFCGQFSLRFLWLERDLISNRFLEKHFLYV